MSAARKLVPVITVCGPQRALVNHLLAGLRREGIYAEGTIAGPNTTIRAEAKDQDRAIGLCKDLWINILAAGRGGRR